MTGISMISRRQALGGAAALGLAGLSAPSWAHGGDVQAREIRSGFDAVSGEDIDLTIARGTRRVGRRQGSAVAVNGSVPGPLVRLKQGQTVRLNVTNTLDEDSSIHWHGLLVPFQYDGVPGVSFPGIAPGETFRYEFPVRQAGTYWWHSHSGLQEQTGHYGPIIIEPDDPDPVEADRDYVLLLSEFTPHHPHRLMAKLKKGEGYFNYQQRSWTDDYPLTAEERRMWAKMRMMPTDILDVTGAEYTYLANGHGPADGLEYAFRPGERVRLRLINGSAMTFFNVRIPGLVMTVVAADGQNVRPVEVDELQIGVAETYDVIVEPRGAAAYTIAAESMDRSGMAVASLVSAPGARADVPALRSPPLLTMADMGMNHGSAHGMEHGASQGMNHGASQGMNHGAAQGMDHGAMGHGAMAGDATDHTAMDHPAMDHGGGSHAAMGHSDQAPASASMNGMDMRDTDLLPDTVKVGPGIDMVSMNPVDRMGDPGIGLATVPHRTLNYRMLRALARNPVRPPTREMEIHLTGNMERYMWSFDGQKFAAVSDSPIRFAHDERVRVKLVNDTMMAHPIHLHGHFFELVNGADAADQPLKHTVIVQPGGSATFDLTANEPGDWAFHCHLLYHMHAGMFQVVSVAFPQGEGA
ncbi:FtsP/CotA-like multicopper oxidase with cupredoxin domain [Pacificimonas flava]|nr:FtsP/CotA-like multicopper oxidase with cupredoxin domain [Pacificimonas flava]